MSKIYVLSGAGLSAESGLATFRSNSGAGIWSNIKVTEVCNAYTWKANREKVFEFYSKLRQEYDNAKPNLAHLFLAEKQKELGENLVILTQNVDSLLERAGCSNVIHLHGSIENLECTACGTHWQVSAVDYNVDTRCPNCNSLKGVKPGIVFFNEKAPQYAHLKKLGKNFEENSFLVVVGTSLEVVNPFQHIRARFKKVGSPSFVQVNPDPSNSPFFGKTFKCSASTGLPLVFEHIFKQRLQATS